MVEAVKGLQGQWHLTDGEWDGTGTKLKTFCGTGISPNYRRFTPSLFHLKLCKVCRSKYKDLLCLGQALRHF